jgi:transcription antitermination factor NusG
MPNEPPRFAAGDRITVVTGPYTDFNGVVTEPAPAPGKIAVKLAFFGRKAQLTLDTAAVAPRRRRE